MSDTFPLPDDRAAIAAEVRCAAGLAPDEGPSDSAISTAIVEFVGQFDYWFTRVIEAAVGKYRTLIIRRINTLVRPIEFDGLSADEVSIRLVTDYVNRNFVTAGGWAIERLAIAIASASGGTKASSRGIDLERTDASGNRHLYVIKSGTVTRNSDILSKLKQHARDAERLIRQGGAKVSVFANYVVAAGSTTSTFEDGIHRPSSGEFWSEVTNLPESQALALVSEITKAAGRQVTRNTDAHIGALVTLVRSYISDPINPNNVDWPFLFTLTMTKKEEWLDQDKDRHTSALELLKNSGYIITKTHSNRPKPQKKLSAKGKLARKGSVSPK